MPTTSRFKIRGMDCAEEIAILKRALVPLVRDEEKLRSDLLNGKMTVDGGSAAESDIVDAVLLALECTQRPGNVTPRKEIANAVVSLMVGISAWRASPMQTALRG